MLFARYIGLREYSMQVQRFYRSDDRSVIFDHVWLRIDDYFEIDVFRDALNMFLKDEEKKQRPVLVSRSRFYVMDDSWDGMRQRLEESGYICESSKWKRFKEEEVRQFFNSPNGLFEQIYESLTGL